jgi:hypothetical protein
MCTLGCALAGCATSDHSDSPIVSSVAADPDGFVAHLEPAPGIRFPLPKTGVSVQVMDFDPTLPPIKFRHELRFVTDADDIEVMVHVWDNPEHLDVRHWFDANIADFVGENTAVSERVATKISLPTIQLDEPASTDAFSQSIAVFATKDHVYSVTCIDPVQVPAAKKLFDRVVRDFEPEIAGVRANEVTR